MPTFLVSAAYGASASRWPRWCGVLLVCGVWCVFHDSASAQPTISRVEPLGVAPGETVPLTVHGVNLTGAGELWTTFSERALLAEGIENNGQDAGRAVFELHVPPEAGLGIHGVRVTTPGGVSGVASIVVDDLPSVAKAGGNQQFESAQLLTLPCAVDGRLDNLTRDFYRFHVAQPGRLTIEVLSRRLGSPLDPILFLYDERGRELAYSDDARGLSSDPQISYQFQRSGDYVVEIRDIRYGGGGNHFYRLRAGDFPAVNTAFPLAISRRGDGRVDFAGVWVDQADPDYLSRLDEDEEVRWRQARTRSFEGSASGFAPVLISETTEFIEHEPNDTPAQANLVELGQGMNGRFAQPGDVDCYRFSATAGQRYLFQGMARRRGSPVDLKLQLLGPEGNVLGTAMDNGLEEGRIDYTFPADGEYVLRVSDLHRHGGSAYAYRIAVTPWKPRFRLTADADTLNVPTSGVARVTVTAERFDYGGPIAVECVGLPEGVTSLPTWIGPGRNFAILTLTADESALSGRMESVRIVGRAEIGGEPFEASATVSGVIRARWSNTTLVPPHLEELAAVAVAPALPLRLTPDSSELVLGRELSTTVRILASRSEGIDQAIQLALVPDNEPVPGGVTFEVKPIDAGQNEVTLAVSANDQTPLGTYTVVLQGTHSKDNVNTVVSTPGITLRLEAPFVLETSLSASGLPRGGELRVPVSVRRNPAFQGEIRLTLDKLPEGVSAAEIIIPADASEGEVVLQAAEEAAVGTAGEVTINGSSVENAKLAGSLVLPTISVE